MSALALLLSIILLALIPTIGAQTTNDILVRRDWENSTRDAALATAELRNSELERIANGVETLLGNASRMSFFNTKEDSCAPFKRLLLNSPVNVTLAVADKEGRIVCSTVSMEHPVNVDDRRFFQSTIHQGTFTIGGYVQSRLSDRSSLVFGYPIRAGTEIVGAVLGYLDLNWLTTTLESARLLPGERLILTDQNGIVLVDLPSERDNRVGTIIPPRYLSMLRARVSGVMDLNDQEGRPAIYAYVPVGVAPPNLYVLFSVRKDIAFAAIDSAILRGLILAVLSVLLGFGSAWIVAVSYFKRPIERLALATKQWRDGDYSQIVPRITGCTELRLLAEDFNRMANGIHHRDSQLQASNHVKELTLATAGHDLRQPIQVLSIVLATFSRRQLSDNERKLVDRGQQSIGRLVDGLDALIDTLRFHRKAEQGRYDIFPVNLTLDELERQFLSKASQQGLTFRVRRSSAIICSEQKMLLTILQNLVGNAIKYTERGGILIGCRRRQARLWIEVYDTGFGVPADKLELIFKDFEQLDPTRDGYGLGLWITRNTAEVLGHELQVRSVVGKGSCFRLIVPLA